MGAVETLKAWIGSDNYRYEYQCQECDSTFESNEDPDSHWLSCPNCDSNDINNLAQ